MQVNYRTFHTIPFRVWTTPEAVHTSSFFYVFSGVPLVYEAFNWKHGVFLGAAMRSEATAAAEHKGSVSIY